MEILEEFEQVKLELREKWLDYYEINREWIELTGLHKGYKWNEIIDGNNITIYCPSVILIIGVVSTLDKRVADFIHTSTQLSNRFDYDKYIKVLGLRFNPEAALEERQRNSEEEIQEAKLLTANEDFHSDLLLEELRREARQLNSNSE